MNGTRAVRGLCEWSVEMRIEGMDQGWETGKLDWIMVK